MALTESEKQVTKALDALFPDFDLFVGRMKQALPKLKQKAIEIYGEDSHYVEEVANAYFLAYVLSLLLVLFQDKSANSKYVDLIALFLTMANKQYDEDKEKKNEFN